ncbi:MAG: septum formation protein Maf [Myxococcales bacterium]|nr:septum formation protein Maf [Myxococcales bacterium]
MSPALILASASPRRKELLARVGIDARVLPAGIDESALPGESVMDYVVRVAAEKARAVAELNPKAWVLAADTIVEEGGEALGKPADEASASAMLGRLRGGVHRVTTAMALHRTGGEPVAHTQAVTTEVHMRAFSDAELAAYVAGGEWRGKAGGYAVQGMAAAFVTEVRGSISNVIGLPLAEVVVLLESLAIVSPSYPADQAH